jgi:uncharacterized membrane protein YccC
VIPLVFAFADLLLNEPQSLIFVIFACFSLLVISDFGGLRRPRALAYLTATIVGGALVALGTFASFSLWLAVAVMFLVGFAVSFSRIFGGYVAVANTGMLLAFVIAVTIPAPTNGIPARIGGWALGGLVSTAAAVALWPRFERIGMYNEAAKALLAVADAVEGIWIRGGQGGTPQLKEMARQAVDAARQRYATMATRPAGPARRDRAFAELLIELDRIVLLIERPFNEYPPAIRPGLAEGDRLAASVVAAMRASAIVLRGGARPDVEAIEVGRNEHRAALDRWAADRMQAGRQIEEVLDGLDFDHTLRAVSYVTFLLGTNATLAAGTQRDVRDTALQVLRTIRAHLESPSTVLQSSLRVAIGLALAVLVAREFALQHAFWVVLGTIQVLRSNALGTGRTAFQALLGNAIGVIIGGLFALAAGNHPTLFWIALPFVVFGAAYAATTIGFMLSQAAFTITLIVIFNLISPAGYQVGLVRIEDVMVGALISLVVGLLLWPRGARRELARALAALYRNLVVYLDHEFDRVLGSKLAEASDSTRRLVVPARDRAGAAFDTFTTERGGGSFGQEGPAFLLSSANNTFLAGDILEVIAGVMGYQATSCADGARKVRDQVRVLLDEYLRLADRLSLLPVMEPGPGVSASALREAALGCMRRWQTDADIGKGAMAVVIAGEWVLNLARLEADLEGSVGVAAEAARRAWWR